jgi:hypothetical protein
MEVVIGHRAPAIWIGTLVFTLFAMRLTSDAAFIAWERKHTLFRRSIRVLRQIRKSYAVPPLLSFLHAVGVAACCAMLAATLAQYSAAANFFTWLAAALLSIAGLVDLIVWGNFFFRRLWSDTLGKIFSISFGAALVAAGVSVSKGIVHSVTHVDPKYFIEATAMLSAVMVPAAYFLFGLTLIYLFAIFQLFRVALAFLAAMLAQQLAGFASSGMRNTLGLLWYRIKNGKRPLGNQQPKRKFLDLASVSLIAKPLSTIYLVLLAVWSSQWAFQQAPLLRNYVEWAIVKLEYRTQSSCAGLDPDTAIVYMDDGKISQARRQGKKFSFSVGTCIFPD